MKFCRSPNIEFCSEETLELPNVVHRPKRNLEMYREFLELENSRAEIKVCKKSLRYDIKLCMTRLHDCGLKEIVHRYQVLLFTLVAMVESLESRMKLIIVLLAVLLLGDKDDCKRIERPDRGHINSDNEYLVRNDGDRFYNGHAKPPRDVLLRKLTDREIGKISMKIGREYVPLAPLLGFTKAELDHIREDNKFAVQRVFEMLFKWRETKESNATIEKLADALEELGINADIIYSSLD